MLYFSPWYAASLQHAPVRELTYLALLAPGFVFFWMFLRVDPVPRAYPYLVGLWVSAAEVVGDAALGLAVLASQSLLAGAYYRALARPWGPGLRSDQIIGGGVLWILGDLVGLPFLAAQFIRMMREDESEAAAVDARLDAQEADPRPPPRVPGPGRPGRPPGPPGRAGQCGGAWPAASPGGRTTRASPAASAALTGLVSRCA